MIGYVTIGTNDLTKATGFYTEVLAPLGGKVFMSLDNMNLFGSKPGAAMLGVARPYDGKPASVGNGVMISLAAKDQDTVTAVYQKALALGGQDEGEPGFRTDTFFGAYFRDLDGNKVAVYTMKQ